MYVMNQVKWSGSQAEYSLEGEFPEMLFTISREGVIYLNAPLDRETQDQVCTIIYNLNISSQHTINPNFTLKHIYSRCFRNT